MSKTEFVNIFSITLHCHDKYWPNLKPIIKQSGYSNHFISLFNTLYDSAETYIYFVIYSWLIASNVAFLRSIEFNQLTVSCICVIIYNFSNDACFHFCDIIISKEAIGIISSKTTYFNGNVKENI